MTGTWLPHRGSVVTTGSSVKPAIWIARKRGNTRDFSPSARL